MPISSDELKQLMRSWTTGVAIVTSVYQSEQHGMTVNSFTSISIDPPVIVVTLAKNTRTYRLVKNSKKFAVSVLSFLQHEVSDRFAGKRSEESDRFKGLAINHLEGLPILNDCLANLACEVLDEYEMQFSTMFIARVTAGNYFGGDPLVYHNRKYYRLAD